MYYSIKNFRTLVAYKKTMNLFSNICNKEYKDKIQLTKLKREIGKVGAMIAKSEGDALYPNYKLYDLKEGINHCYKSEKLLKDMDIDNKEGYLKSINEIRKILFGLKKKEEGRKI